MALETAPASTASDGNLRITYVPTGNALSVAILNAVPALPLTYSFTPTGFKRAITEAVVPDPRLTQKQILSRPGIKTEQIDVQYVMSTSVGSAQVVLTEGTVGFLNLRYVLPNATTFVVAQVVDVVTFVAGAQRKDEPVANGIATISQTLYCTAVTITDGVLVA